MVTDAAEGEITVVTSEAQGSRHKILLTSVQQSNYSVIQLYLFGHST